MSGDQAGSHPTDALLAEIRRAWRSSAASRRARSGLGAVQGEQREAFTALLDEADEQRRGFWLGFLPWFGYFGLASAIIPWMILLGAPHLMKTEAKERLHELEETARPVVYIPPPPEPEEEPPPVLDPEKVTGPVRPTSPGSREGSTDGIEGLMIPSLDGVISARIDPSVASPTWLQAFQGGSGGSGGGSGGGQGIPEGMVYVPPGTFPMGTMAGVGESHEHPRHPVELTGYAIDRDEVNVGAFNRWCGDQESGCGWRLEHSSSMMADHPVTGVTWYEARAFCRWYGKDLPTEAQWERAARYDVESGSTGIYPWGDDAPTCAHANYLDCHHQRTVPLGTTRGSSPVGARDMAGNAREWVLDRFGRYAATKQVDPRGAPGGDLRVLRGGSFGGAAEDIRATDRDAAPPDMRLEYNGFRCAVQVIGEPVLEEEEVDVEVDVEG